LNLPIGNKNGICFKEAIRPLIASFTWFIRTNFIIQQLFVGCNCINYTDLYHILYYTSAFILDATVKNSIDLYHKSIERLHDKLSKQTSLFSY
jgi:hypothetical protein